MLIYSIYNYQGDKMFGFLKNLKKVTLPLNEKYELIARNRLSPSTADFEPNTNGKSLIHYACLFNNVELLKKCLSTQSIKNTLDFHKRPAIDYAFDGQSINILEYLVSEFNLDIPSLFDEYKQPLWWKGFSHGVYSCVEKKNIKTFESYDYEKYIKFLVKNKVDLNQRGKLLFDSNLAYKLLSEYNHKPLYYLIKSDLVDVNTVSRTDCSGTLVHWCGFMEDHRARAFQQRENSYINQAYNEILNELMSV